MKQAFALVREPCLLLSQAFHSVRSVTLLSSLTSPLAFSHSRPGHDHFCGLFFTCGLANSCSQISFTVTSLGCRTFAFSRSRVSELTGAVNSCSCEQLPPPCSMVPTLVECSVQFRVLTGRCMLQDAASYSRRHRIYSMA